MASSGGNSENTAVYCLKNVVKVREKGGNVFELHLPEFIIQPGQFVALVGQSGCGKSTLLDMLAMVLGPTQAERFTLRVPSSGRTFEVPELNEEQMARLRMAELGYVLQTGGLLPFLSVRDNIMLPCRINNRGDADSQVAMLVERLDIAGQMGKKPQYLSGGQRQRVAIARALAHQPPIVLADEPTAAVDKLSAREIRDKFKELTASMGVTVLMVTHDESLVAPVVDRIFRFQVSRQSPEHVISKVIEEQGVGGRS
jgi:putative ABC transport system ATP-binding protein